MEQHIATRTVPAGAGKKDLARHAIVVLYNRIYNRLTILLSRGVYLFVSFAHTNKRKRALERYRIARIVIKPRGWISHWDPWDLPAAYAYISCDGVCECARARPCVCARVRARVHADSPDSYIDPTDLISSRRRAIPWALAHPPTKEHLCEPIRNAPATCSQVARPYAQHEFIISLV